jgi:hypothetical protein
MMKARDGRHPIPPEAIIGKTCEGQEVTWAEIEAASKDVREWFKLKTTSGSCSIGLAYQLAAHYRRIHRCSAIASFWSMYMRYSTR